jgi:hypothetical protein
MASEKANANGITTAKNNELSIEDVLGEQASELPEKALMRHHRHNSSYYYDCHYDYCYPSYCYPSYCYPCYPSYCG